MKIGQLPIYSRSPRLTTFSGAMAHAQKYRKPLDWLSLIDVRESLSSFVHHLAEARGGDRFESEPVALMMERVLQWSGEHNRHLIIASPPSLYKSYTTRQYCMWRLANDPLLRIVFCSLNTRVSDGMVADARSRIVKPDFLRAFPEIKPDREAYRRHRKEEYKGLSRGFRQNRFYLKNADGDVDPAMEAVAFKGEAANRRVDLGVFDDVETLATIGTKERRDSTFKTLMDNWINGRLISGTGSGQAIILANFWHEDDIVHRLANHPDFTSLWFHPCPDTLDALHVELHGIPDDAPHPLDEETCEEIGLYTRGDRLRCPFPNGHDIYNRAALTKKQVSTPNFSAIYLNQPTADEDRMFPNWHTRRVYTGTVAEMHRLRSPEGLPHLMTLPSDKSGKFSFVWTRDVSGMKRRGNCLSLWSVDMEGVMRPCEFYFRRTMPSGEMISIIENARQRGIFPASVVVEDNATQDALILEFEIEARRQNIEWRHLIRPHHTGGNKMSLDEGLPRLDVMMATGMVEWPSAMADMPGDVGDNWRMAEGQMASCPRFPRPNETPEAPMVAWFAMLALRNHGPTTMSENYMETVPVASGNGHGSIDNY